MTISTHEPSDTDGGKLEALPVRLLAPLLKPVCDGDDRLAAEAAYAAIDEHHPRSEAGFPVVTTRIAASLAGIAALVRSVDSGLDIEIAQHIHQGSLHPQAMISHRP
jgi:hypothetical protein